MLKEVDEIQTFNPLGHHIWRLGLFNSGHFMSPLDHWGCVLAVGYLRETSVSKFSLKLTKIQKITLDLHTTKNSGSVFYRTFSINSVKTRIVY